MGQGRLLRGIRYIIVEYKNTENCTDSKVVFFIIIRIEWQVF